MLLANKVAIVSGIGPGMGRDISLAFAREGAKLALAARSAGKLEKVAGGGARGGRRAIAVPTDITQPEDCARLVAAAQSAFGRVDVLVNNAFHQGTFSPVESADLAKWREPFEVNVLGTLRLTQQVIPLMKNQRRRLDRDDQLDGDPRRAADDGRLRGLEGGADGGDAGPRARARPEPDPRELASSRATSGARRSSGTSAIWPSAAASRRSRSTTRSPRNTALRHLPTSEEIATAVVFFASDLSRVITGQSLDVNGGHVFK